ncbi:MAG: FAD-binding protein [Oscillospiraceae bacterium]|nr:FAD-binding protein [Oscillospiraceae bacterium]
MSAVKTDILVVGGSLAGMAAAIKIKELSPETDVTIVEKYTAGYSGKANRGAGIIVTLGNSKPEDFVKYHTTYIGDNLNKQDALLKFAQNMNDGLEDLDRWCAGKICKNPDGSFKTLKWLAQITGQDENGKRTFDEPDHFPWTLAAVELDYMKDVRNTARKAGVKFVDRVGIVDLLKKDGKVTGAVGFGMDDGERKIFTAKAVVLATGSQNYRIMPMWSPGRGEGLAAAWRAGAKVTNCEFGSFYNWTSPDNFESNMGVEFALFNDKGENVGAEHTQGEHPDVDQNSLAEWYKQTRDGNGPLHYRVQANPLMPYLTSILASDSYYDRPYADRFWGYLFFNAFSQQTSDVCIPGLIGEFSPLRVDENFATTVPGLFAAGDICYGGSRATGAVPPPPGRVRGSGLGFALYSGRAVAEGAIACAKAAAEPEYIEADAEAVEKRFKAPVTAGGTIAPMDFLREFQKVIQPLGNSLYRHEERLNAAIKRVEELRAELKNVAAVTPHHLFEVNEFESMLLCAEMFFKASLLRKESRGWFLREDYPEHSDELKWYSFENVNGEMVPSEETVPQYDIF